MKNSQLILSTFTDNHTHVFDEKCVADGYIGHPLLQKLVNTYPKTVTWILDKIIPSKKDTLSKYASFTRSVNRTMLQNLNELKKLYPKNTSFAVLAINMHYMKAGKVEKPFAKQMQELIGLKQAGEPILIYYHAVPDDPECMSLLDKYKDKIEGIKIYPLMGYFPYDKCMFEVYQICSDLNLPVISHTAPVNPTHYRDENDIHQRLENSVITLMPDTKTQAELCANFSHPLNLRYTAKQFLKVNFCAAHLGGKDEIQKFIDNNEIDYIIGKRRLGTKKLHDLSWTYHILQACIDLPNFYTDTSFSISNPEYYNLISKLLDIPILQNKILFGSDYYMNKTVATQDAYYRNFKSAIGIFKFSKISRENLLKFYKI
jgi:predicted TIM-barrel fold metal-dependent hydrolase